MGSFHDDVITAVVGAIAGGAAGALSGWFIGPSQAEREERGRRRIEGRSQIAAAVGELSYQVREARGRLFRLEDPADLLDRANFLKFANSVKQGPAFLRWLERLRVKRKARKLTGRFVWRLAELVPSDHFVDVDEASVLQATADTRTSIDRNVFGPTLGRYPPTDPRWNEVFKLVDKMRKSYPT
jgi:glycine/D-amino acid oxidase-like deaminating enzyme